MGAFIESHLRDNHVAYANHTNAFCQPEPRLRCARGVALALCNEGRFATVDELLYLALYLTAWSALLCDSFDNSSVYSPGAVD